MSGPSSAAPGAGAPVPAGGPRGVGGTTSIGDAVVAKIARLAAQEVDGVAGLGGTFSGALSGMVALVRGDEHRTAGVDVEVGRLQAAIDLTASLHYPAPLEAVTEALRARVIERVEAVTGLKVVEVNVEIADLVVDTGEEPEAPVERARVA